MRSIPELGPNSPLRAVTKPARAKSRHAEHYAQAALMQWLWTLPESRYPGARWAYAVPNAAARSPQQGAWMKAEGLRAGVPDVVVPAKRGPFGHLYVELKDEAKHGTKRGLPSDEQARYHAALVELGHCVCLCYGTNAAMAAVEWYFTAPIPALQVAYERATLRVFSPR